MNTVDRFYNWRYWRIKYLGVSITRIMSFTMKSTNTSLKEIEEDLSKWKDMLHSS